MLHDGTRSGTRRTRRPGDAAHARRRADGLLVRAARRLGAALGQRPQSPRRRSRVHDRARDHRSDHPADTALCGRRRRPRVRRIGRSRRSGRLPGVAAAGATTIVPLGGIYANRPPRRRGLCPAAGRTGRRPVCAALSRRATSKPWARRSSAAATSTSATPPRARRAIVIDERLARRFWPDEDPIGRRDVLAVQPEPVRSIDPDTPWLTVVGVVRDAHLRGPAGRRSRRNERDASTCPTPSRRRATVGFVIRTHGEPTAIVRDVRAALAQIDREIPLFDVRTLSERTELALMSRTNTMQLATLFAAVARVPVGDRPLRRARVSRDAALARDWRPPCARQCAAGDRRTRAARRTRPGARRRRCLASSASLLLGRLVASQLYGITPSNPWVMLLMMLALSAVARCLHCPGAARRQRGRDEDPQRALDVRARQRTVHNASESTSLMKIRFPDIAGCAHVALSATV